MTRQAKLLPFGRPIDTQSVPFTESNLAVCVDGEDWQCPQMARASLKALALNCTLKTTRKGEASSTDVLLKQLMDALKEQGAEGEVMRVADLDIKPGVTSDEGDGDQWPAVRARVVACDILVIGSPIWLRQPSKSRISLRAVLEAREG